MIILGIGCRCIQEEMMQVGRLKVATLIATTEEIMITITMYSST